MRAPRMAGGGSLEFNMTPMIDVTFLLIIFFLVSSHLAQQETQLELDLPSASAGRSLTDDATRRLTVNVTSEGEILLGNQPMDGAELARRMEYENAQHASDKPLEVRVRCDRRTPYRFIERVLQACTLGGVWNVSFSVIEKTGAASGGGF